MTKNQVHHCFPEHDSTASSNLPRQHIKAS